MNISTEQRTRVTQVISKHREARVDRVDFDVRVGTVVPRTVRVYDLPPDIIEIVPEWRRYKYIIVKEEIVIIEPDSLRIVAVVHI